LFDRRKLCTDPNEVPRLNQPTNEAPQTLQDIIHQGFAGLQEAAASGLLNPGVEAVVIEKKLTFPLVKLRLASFLTTFSLLKQCESMYILKIYISNTFYAKILIYLFVAIEMEN
jgi:hypothetical protein